MTAIDKHILEISNVISENIDQFDASQRGLLSQNILSQLRNFVEYISLKEYGIASGQQFNIHDIHYDNIKNANEYIKARGDLKFLSRFHKLLKITVSHYTLDKENSERLMLKYCEYLIRIKSYLKSKHNLDVLRNIHEFPIQIDDNLNEYYQKIADKVNQSEAQRTKSTYKDRYYIQKIKPFFVDFQIYYEVTFRRASDYASKFDRIIAFTKLDILPNYAVKLNISNDSISILGKAMPIQIIDEWEVSIRPCELNNFAKILGGRKISDGKEPYELMKHLTSASLSLVELIDLNDHYYSHVRNSIVEKAKSSRLFKVLDYCRNISKKQADGYNVIRYLLYRLNNKIIKSQYENNPCHLLFDLQLSYKCIPFDDMPYNSSLVGHNPRLSDLFTCIDVEGREYELLARLIKNNTVQGGKLYTSHEEVETFGDVDKLIETYNDWVYWKHPHRHIETFNQHHYIKGYEDETHQIIKQLQEISSEGITNYRDSVQSWLETSLHGIDCEEKKEALEHLFVDSKVALIYGAAGTGKSTMINYISNFFGSDKKLFLANTNPAVDNLKRRVKAANSTFKTIAKFLYSADKEYDILIVDECSTVSNEHMLKILNQSSFRLLILVGDVFQIESIQFGNWFSLAKSFVPNSAVFELLKPYRSENQSLLTLWERVRDIDDRILESLTRNGYTFRLDQTIFQHTDEDEIILCLNYDGLYGINNINTFLQSSNNNSPIVWGTHTYKVNDPIIFNENNRFAPLIYNNLKGRIIDIEVLDDQIRFDIEVDKSINGFEAEIYDFELLENTASRNSVIRFLVNQYKSTDEDDDSASHLVPFQVAYAVSIHKAQGLEYSSVKIVITNEVEEMISHNIFYTAITRAKEKLKIYWTPETEKTVLEGLEKNINSKDLSLFKLKYNL